MKNILAAFIHISSFSLCLLPVSTLCGCGSNASTEKEWSQLEARIKQLESRNELIQHRLEQLERNSLQQVSPSPATVPSPLPGAAVEPTDPMISVNKTNELQMQRQRQQAERKRLHALLTAFSRQHPPERIAELLNERKMGDNEGRPWNAESVVEQMRRFGLKSEN